MNQLIKACEILNLETVKIQYNNFDDGPSFDEAKSSSHGLPIASKFVVDSMTCSACVAAIEAAIQPLYEGEAMSVSLPLSRASVAHYESSVSTSDIVVAIEKSGYGARHGSRTAQQNCDLARQTEDLAKQKSSFSNAVSLASTLSLIDWVRVAVPQISSLHTLLGLVRVPLSLRCQVVEAEWIHARAWRKGWL